MIILIPAYEPDARLVALVESIRVTVPDQRVLVVDDGSGPAYTAIFDGVRAFGGEVIGHAENRGKGFALRKGFAHVAEHHRDHDVVCADCDGQHTVVDILRVAEALRTHRDGPVLGARQFLGDVPLRSRFGNSATRILFSRATGLALQDTQTGLRGYPASMLGWLLTVPGDRFEYELDVLLEAQRQGFGFQEVPIETIYLDGNESSHFRTIRDSVRVYVPLVKFSLSSLSAFAVDATIFFVLMAVTGSLVVSVVTARLVSASMNFAVNRRVVFGADGSPRRSAVRYGALVGVLLVANYGLLRLLTVVLPVPLVPAKLATEVTLFALSYQVQRRLVFAAHDPVPVRSDDAVATGPAARPQPSPAPTHQEIP